MTDKNLTALTKKYDEFNIGKFDLPHSEILFYPALDALEFFYKKISKITPASKEDKSEFESLKNLTRETLVLGYEILNEHHTFYRRNKMRDFFKYYGEVLVYSEEIPQ